MTAPRGTSPYHIFPQIDPLRLTRHLSVSGFGCSPIYENSISLVLSDGRVLVWDIKKLEDDDDVDESDEESAERVQVTIVKIIQLVAKSNLYKS